MLKALSSQVTDDKVHIDEYFPPSCALHSPVRASPPFTRTLPPLTPLDAFLLPYL